MILTRVYVNGELSASVVGPQEPSNYDPPAKTITFEDGSEFIIGADDTQGEHTLIVSGDLPTDVELCVIWVNSDGSAIVEDVKDVQWRRDHPLPEGAPPELIEFHARGL